MNHEIELEIYSARWGHTDPYTIKLSKDELKVISIGTKSTTCTHTENEDPKWNTRGETLRSIFVNDQITPPAGVQDDMVYIWQAWREGRTTNEEATADFKLLAEWINNTTKNEPDFKSFS